MTNLPRVDPLHLLVSILALFKIRAFTKWNWASWVAQMVKNLPAMWDTWVWSLGQEDPLEKGMATLSSILTWRIPWTEEPARQQSMGLQSDSTEWLFHHTFQRFEVQLRGRRSEVASTVRQLKADFYLMSDDPKSCSVSESTLPGPHLGKYSNLRKMTELWGMP